MSDKNMFALAVVFYGLSVLYSIFIWRKGFRQANLVNYSLLLSGFLLHTGAMVRRGFSLSHCPVNNLYEAIIFVDWTIVASFLILGLWPKLRFLGVFASPIIFGMGVFALMPALDPPFQGRPDFRPSWASIHAAFILLSFGAFGISCVSALMYLTEEHDLKLHKLRAILSKLPPIERLEKISGRTLFAGFILLSIGLLISLYQFQRPALLQDPLMLWSAAVWLLYLALLVMRWKFAARGRRFAWGTVASFAFVLMTFWGFYLLSGIHQR